MILTHEEAIRLIDSASNLFHRAMLITMYSTGMRRAELCRLKVADIDSTRMLIHIRQGKGGSDRDVPLSPKVLETLREYWRWMKPKTYMFPGTINGSAPTNPSRPKFCGRRAGKRRSERGSRKPYARICCATASPPTCRRRSGPADRSGAARAYRPQAHLYLSASVRAAHQSGGHTARQHGAFQSRPGKALAEAAQKMTQPPFEVADIIRTHGNSFVDRNRSWLTWLHLRVLFAIEHCRTAVLGGHLDRCRQCGHEATSFNSCRSRHCPKCQTNARNRWLADRHKELLPVSYVHVVFTIPHELAWLALQNKKVVYDLLFRASAATLLEIAADPKHMGAEIGFLSVLHTWGQICRSIRIFIA